VSSKPLLDIGDKEWRIVEAILKQHAPEREVWAFGSRAKWTAKEFSDLDLAILGEKSLTLDESASLADAFADSDLPWKVDVVDWATTSPSFRKIIKRDKVVVQSPSKFETLCSNMSSEWHSTTIGDICSKVFSGGTPTSTNSTYYDGGTIPWLRTKEVNYGKIYDTEEHITKLGFENSSTKLVPVNSVIVAMYGNGDTAGRVAVNKVPVTTNQACCNLVVDTSKADYRFVYYYLMGQYKALVDLKNGGAQQNLNGQLIKSFPIALPAIAEQVEISTALESIDDRITLLRETNTTLEAIAQALFKSWFVDFDPVHAKMQGRAPEGMDEATIALFPDGFEESELGSVPKGWGLSTVGKAFVLTMGQSPPGDTYNQKADGLPFYQGRTDFGFRFPTKRIYCNAPTRLAEIGDALVSVRAPVGDVNMAIETCCIGRGVAAVRHPDGCSGYTFYTMRNLGERFKNFNSEGTVFGSINKKDFEALPVLEPSHPVLLAFDKFSKALDGRIVINEEQIRLLVELRDALLPRLISGALKVSSEESLVEGER
jgi:type I restriction enzyme, S subunit